MTAPDKPGLSNEEFIKYWRGELDRYLPDWEPKGLRESLDRLEALIRQGKPTPGQIGLVEK